jgi:hypothetical protein
MLKQSILAQLPLVTVSTRDVINLPEVIESITKRSPPPGCPTPRSRADALFCGHDAQERSAYNELYHRMLKVESTLIVVNPSKVVEPMFNAGELPVPREMMLFFAQAVVTNKDKAEVLVRSLGGCTLKEASEYFRLTMQRDQSLTPRASCRPARAVSWALTA